MNYLIIGAGGTGGAIAGYIGKAGKDVTVIARGEHLKAIQSNGGLWIIRPGDEFFAPVKASDTDHFHEIPDVIFVCVKSYSIPNVIPFIRRVVFGVRDPEEYRPELKMIKQDLDESGIMGILSDNIRRDALLKFSYVSPQGACGLYYNIPAGPMQKGGIYRDTFTGLVHEIDLLAHAMGITFEEDIVQRNLKILDDLTPDMTTSMQKDIAAASRKLTGSFSSWCGLPKSIVSICPFTKRLQ